MELSCCWKFDFDLHQIYRPQARWSCESAPPIWNRPSNGAHRTADSGPNLGGGVPLPSYGTVVGPPGESPGGPGKGWMGRLERNDSLCPRR